LARNDLGQQAMTLVTLRPLVQFAGAQPTAQALHDLHHCAHASCYLANSVKTEVLCEPIFATESKP
jgi:organic hydroperoxide reductase OsmC/OhrA